MNNSLNRVTLIGHVCDVPRVFKDQSGALRAQFLLATTDTSIEKASLDIPRTIWHQIVAAHRTAAYIRSHVKRGKCVYIEGMIHSRVNLDEGSGKTYIHSEIHVLHIVEIAEQMVIARSSAEPEEHITEVDRSTGDPVSHTRHPPLT